MKNYVLKYIEDSSIEEISQLFHLVWDFDEFDKVYSKTKWAFDNDFSKVILYFDDNNLISVRGGILWPLYIKDKKVNTIQLHGTCVHPNYRRLGIFTLINKDYLKESIKENIDFIFNVSVDSSRAGYEKLGWKYIKGFRRLTYFRKPLKVGLLKKNTEREEDVALLDEVKSDIEIPIEFINARNNRLQNTIHCKYNGEFLRWRLSNTYEKYKKIQTDKGIIIYKVKFKKGVREIIIGECFLLNYKYNAFSSILKKLFNMENPDIVYTYISKHHPCYFYFIRKLFLPNPKKYNLNFGTKILNENLQSDLKNNKWAVSFLDIDTF